ncbi:MAG TPA: undecaprenyl-phosphate glucose phosphotransferase [Steroidobacteraceae bacterium]|jgi:putative colanic acid biosynthesis UDP-glucose lipid carrier transferase|nr:undecaprenyl-phosphate glucose phosphotransferase [Steroidobacteraceae bacterium]
MSSVAESFAHRRVRLGNVEPALVALLKQLDPLIVVLSLFCCARAFGEQSSPAFVMLTLLTWVISGQLFDRVGASEAASAGNWDFGRSYTRLLLQWIMVVGMLFLAGLTFKATDIFSRQSLLTWILVTPLALTGSHLLRRRVRWRAENGASASRYIIIGVNDVGVELARRLPAAGFMGYFDFRSVDRVAQVTDPEKLAGHCRDTANFVRGHGIRVVYIALPLANVPRMSELVNALRDTTASVYFVPDAFAFDLIQGRLVEINGMPALSVCETPLHGLEAVFKRAMDLVIASVALLALSPLLLAVAAAVKLTSRGPVFFRQRRYGLDGEEIVVYKFRSMRVCEDGTVVTQATKEDPRVTRIGAMLRKTSIDELPQLLNVVQGKMSLVGPRPHAIAHNELYRKLINGYMIRHKVRPGITGYAQVNGLRGETETLEKMSERVRYDLEYLRKWSPWLDVKILFKTLGVVLHDQRNAY